ncbi:MAG TPA: extensin family protein [Thermohalobaculum sp.]|nr:extensin family protein [Thermohalobaculum sp.]
MIGVIAALGPVLALALAAPATTPVPPPRPAPPAPAVAVAPAPLPGPGEIVCRDPRLMGDPRPTVIDIGEHACGIVEPVRVGSVAGMRLEPAILVGCPTARRLADWLDGVVRGAALEHLQARVAVVRTKGSYACRSQNHVAGGRRSEHARGRAVDIGGFTLTDGREVTLARDWGDGTAGAFLRRIWGKACGPFATVLGPDADRHHRDHFHLDTAPRGGRPHCR